MANEIRIVMLGKTGAGKSSLGNTIFGEKLFEADDTPASGTVTCKAETKSVDERSITFIDTPGFFDTRRPKEEMREEIARCITESAPGPHAFLILLKVERYTEQEEEVIKEICQQFTEEALKYSILLFTHGDQLPKGMKIEQFVGENQNLRDLVEKCGGRCHVVDNKYWKSNQEDEYRSNRFQVKELLKTLDKMIKEKQGKCFTNDMLKVVKKKTPREKERIRKTLNKSPEQIEQEAKTSVTNLLVEDRSFRTENMLSALGEQIAKTVEALTESPPVSVMEEVVEEACETLLDKVYALCEKIYNLLNTQQ